MKTIKNVSKRHRAIPGNPALIIAPNESKDVTESVFESLKSVAALVERGLIEVSGGKPEPDPEEPEERQTVEVSHQGGGWYRVYVGGIDVAEKNLRKDEAEAMAAEYN